MGVDSDNKIDRRGFLRLSAIALSSALVHVFLGDTKAPASPNTTLDVPKENTVSLPKEVTENVSIEQLLAEFEELTLAQKTEMLWSEEEINIPLEHISSTVTEIQQMPTVTFGALGDSVIYSAHFNLFAPEAWQDSFRVNFGEHAELQQIVPRFNILVDSFQQPFGPLIGATLQALNHESAFCGDDELCLPNESITDSVIRQEPKIVFICAGRNGMSELGVVEDFNDFAQELDVLCQRLLSEGIIPVIMNFPIIRQVEEKVLPDLEAKFGQSEDWERLEGYINNDLTRGTSLDAWLSFYAQKRNIPHLNPLKSLSSLPNYGLNIADQADIVHFSNNFQGGGLHYKYDRPMAEWSGSEMINYLVAKFLEQLINE